MARTKKGRRVKRPRALLAAAAAGALAFLVMVGIVAPRIVRLVQTRREVAAVFERLGMTGERIEDFMALPTGVPYEFARAQLGRRLFNCPLLGRNELRTCVYCHELNNGGTDGKLHNGTITRSVHNAVFANCYMRDGAVTNLREAVVQMIEGWNYCGKKAMSNAVAAVRGDAALAAEFGKLYEDGVTAANMLDAIEQHMRTLFTPRTKFDWWCGGDKTALTPTEVRGMRLFRSRGCLDCHSGPAFGGFRVSRGRKVPMLRGLGARKAYLSDASQSSPEAVVRMMPGGDMEEAELLEVLAFLKCL